MILFGLYGVGLYRDSDLVRHLFLVSVFLDFLLLQIVSDVIGKRMWQDTTPQVIGEVEGIEK